MTGKSCRRFSFSILKEQEEVLKETRDTTRQGKQRQKDDTGCSHTSSCEFGMRACEPVNSTEHVMTE